MGRKDVRIVQWKDIYVLQIGLLAAGINISVGNMQYFYPIAYFLVKEANEEEGNLYIYCGIVLSSHYFGRALTWPVWKSMGDACGRKTIINVAIMTCAIFTFIIGFTQDLLTVIVLRFLAGVFSPTTQYTKVTQNQHLSRDYSINCFEEFPKVSKLNSATMGVSLLTGLLIGGLLAYPAQTGVADEDSGFALHPFLLPSFISTLLLIFSFIVLSAKLDDPKPPQVPIITSPPQEPENETHFTQYVEIAPQTNIPQNQHEGENGPMTERHENQNYNEDEDIPSYLQVSALEQFSHESEEEEDYSNRSRPTVKHVRFFSPKNVSQKTAIGYRQPMSARNQDQENRFQRLEEEDHGSSPRQSLEDPELPPDDPKRTHISFIEEDFEEPPQQPVHPEQVVINVRETLDDPFQRP